jgi:tetratricopeptide (TPR) repeat protein
MNNEGDCFLEAKRLEDQGKFDLAAEQYENAIKLCIGDQAIAHQGRGRALARLGHLEEAIDECQKALELNLNLYLAHGVLGYIYFQQAKYDLAESELLTTLRLRPNDVVALNNLISIYSNLGRYQEAMATCEKVIQHQPENLERRVLLANFYLIQSRFREAIGQLNKVFAANPAKFKIYPLYAVAWVNAVVSFFSRLSVFAWLGAGLSLYLIALLAPSFLSIPVGIVLSAFALLVMLTNLWFRNYKHKGKGLILSAFVFPGIYCLIYWWIVIVIRSGQ